MSANARVVAALRRIDAPGAAAADVVDELRVVRGVCRSEGEPVYRAALSSDLINTVSVRGVTSGARRPVHTRAAYTRGRHPA